MSQTTAAASASAPVVGTLQTDPTKGKQNFQAYRGHGHAKPSDPATLTISGDAGMAGRQGKCCFRVCGKSELNGVENFI
jgi:hypothetical protein